MSGHISGTLAAWQRHPSHASLWLPADPAERDRYILKAAASWRRQSENDLNAAVTEWLGSSGRERALWRRDVVVRGARYRAAMRLYHDVWRAFCAGCRAAKEAA